MKGVEERRDRRAGVEWAGKRQGSSHQEPVPLAKLELFSYRLVMPCHRHCSLHLSRDPSPPISGTVLPSGPKRLQTSLSLSHPLRLSLRKAFSRQLPRIKWLQRGERKKKKKNVVEKMRFCVGQFFFSSLLPHLPLPFQSLRLSSSPAFPTPSPSPRPVSHCAGKSDFLFS